MRVFFISLIFYFSFCLAQTDSMFVEMTDGTIKSYPIPHIDQIYFTALPTSADELDIMQKIISSFTLSQNYPNPFNPNTTIQYSIPEAGEVEVNIFDIRGRLIYSLKRSHGHGGVYSFLWDSRSNSGHEMASGTYFCRVHFNGTALTRKLLLIK